MAKILIKMTRMALSAGALLLAAASGATIQAEFELPDNDEPEIVVYGFGDVDRAVSDFVRNIGRDTSTDQLARWHEAICPMTMGLSDELNDYVSDMIIAVAEEVGADAQPGDCQANVLVVITDDPTEIMGPLQQDRIDIFRSVSIAERSAIERGETDVLAFSRIQVRGADGRLPNSSARIDTSGKTSTAQSLEVSGAILTGVEAGRIRLSTRADLNFRAIIIDSDYAQGRALQQLAAFAAMMALAEFDVREPITPAFTILNLFHDAENAPADLTNWDLAYLQALYATDGAYDARGQRSAMIREVRTTLNEE